ncbi:hypothetical protein QBC44DRAFT_97067 [Cladorrhinum sp. PSN332]|nr:hypothetical protein QBC44DRAFT_97067 [Cladorrhinum sp. PSN332]
MACRVINLVFTCFLLTLALLAIVQSIRERGLIAEMRKTTPFDTLTGVHDNLTHWSTPVKRYAPWHFVDMGNVTTNDTNYCMVHVQLPESDLAAWTAYPIFISVFNNDFTALYYTNNIPWNSATREFVFENQLSFHIKSPPFEDYSQDWVKSYAFLPNNLPHFKDYNWSSFGVPGWTVRQDTMMLRPCAWIYTCAGFGASLRSEPRSR